VWDFPTIDMIVVILAAEATIEPILKTNGLVGSKALL